MLREASVPNIPGVLLLALRQAAPPAADEDARLALTALLVRVARSDGHYHSTEKAEIDAAMSRRYGLEPPAMANFGVDV